ncbi:hypothetical protein THOM_1732 [Trachipleistophora hominis]|uniref:Uncharacterized protein n=1 Tax=Trachipleistophora hominis TaxID=72359 RepID=L7JWB9_TRAHO|nr:hypothetical protein THOM_1732 [Trachipleistophora hominis]
MFKSFLLFSLFYFTIISSMNTNKTKNVKLKENTSSNKTEKNALQSDETPIRHSHAGSHTTGTNMKGYILKSVIKPEPEKHSSSIKTNETGKEKLGNRSLSGVASKNANLALQNDDEDHVFLLEQRNTCSNTDTHTKRNMSKKMLTFNYLTRKKNETKKSAVIPEYNPNKRELQAREAFRPERKQKCFARTPVFLGMAIALSLSLIFTVSYVIYLEVTKIIRFGWFHKTYSNDYNP